jgi:hypothetical protein
VGRGKRIRDHIATVGRREPADYAVLAEALQSVTWPDGGVDRRHPDAPTWLNRFMALQGDGPEPIPRGCGCTIGRCLVCN